MIGNLDKKGVLTNPAERDHCAQYVVAVGLIHGELNAADFEDEFAADPRIDELRAKMTIVEEPRYTLERRDPDKRSNANAIEVRFRDGSSAPKVEVEYPWGHPRRRAEAIPMLERKFKHHLRRFSRSRQMAILDLFREQTDFETMPVNAFCDSFVIER